MAFGRIEAFAILPVFTGLNYRVKEMVTKKANP